VDGILERLAQRAEALTRLLQTQSAMSALRISFVPSKIRLMRESRTACSYGYSFEKPMPLRSEAPRSPHGTEPEANTFTAALSSEKSTPPLSTMPARS
jgi:hypothetical protein